MLQQKAEPPHELASCILSRAEILPDPVDSADSLKNGDCLILASVSADAVLSLRV